MNPNKADALNPAIASRFADGRLRHGGTDPEPSMVTRALLHFVVWVFALPWAASSLWLAIDGAMRTPPGDWGGVAGRVVLAPMLGLAGVIECLLVTVPLACVAIVSLLLFPEWLRRRGFRVGFIVTTSATGFAWAILAARSINTGRAEYPLLVIGALAGLALGFFTISLWRVKTPEPPAA